MLLKGKHSLIKGDILRDIDTTTRVQTPITLMMRAISQKRALTRMKLEFVSIIGTKKRKARTSKHSECRIVRSLVK